MLSLFDKECPNCEFFRQELKRAYEIIDRLTSKNDEVSRDEPKVRPEPIHRGRSIKDIISELERRDRIYSEKENASEEREAI